MYAIGIYTHFLDFYMSIYTYFFRQNLKVVLHIRLQFKPKPASLSFFAFNLERAAVLLQQFPTNDKS